MTFRSWKSCKSDILIGWSVARYTTNVPFDHGNTYAQQILAFTFREYIRHMDTVKVYFNLQFNSFQFINLYTR